MLTRASALRGLALGAAAISIPRIARSAALALQVGQIGNNSIAFFPVFVAKQQGYFSDAGLDVTLTAFQSGSVAGAALTSGSIDIACCVITDVFSLLRAHRSAKIIGSLVDGYYVDVIGSNAFLHDARVSRASSLHDRVAALKGKRIGITGPGSGTEALVDYLFKTAGLDPTRDAELVNVGTDQASIVTQLTTGRLDAVSFAWPLSMVAEVKHVGETLIRPAAGDVPAMRGEIQGVMAVREDTLVKRADATIAFVKAIARAQAFIHKETAKADVLLRAYDAQLDAPTIAKLQAAYLPVLPQSPRVPVAAYDKALAFHRVTGYAGPTGDAYADVVAADLIDKALKS